MNAIFLALDNAPCPNTGITYVASVPELEKCEIFHDMMQRGFAGMPIQIGYCNGTNDTLNCLEYHKSSEFNILKDDIVLLLGLKTEIEDGVFDTAKVKAFHVTSGVAVELYATTLHYASCDYETRKGFRMFCVLPTGTNEEMKLIPSKCEENKRFFARNKWLLVYPESEYAKKADI